MTAQKRPRVPRDHAGLPNITTKFTLGATSVEQPVDVRCWPAAMRNPYKATQANPKHVAVGQAISALLDDMLDHDTLQADCLAAIGSSVHQGPSDKVLQSLRQRLAHLLFLWGGNDGTYSSQDPVPLIDTQSPIHGKLLHSWATVANDPGAFAAEWIWAGAPSGIIESFDQVDGLLPPSKKIEELEDHAELHTDFDHFVNYHGIEDDADIDTMLDELVMKLYLKDFDTLEQCREFLEADPVLSRLGCVSRGRWSASEQRWKTKKRMVLDTKRSRISTPLSRSIAPSCHASAMRYTAVWRCLTARR